MDEVTIRLWESGEYVRQLDEYGKAGIDWKKFADKNFLITGASGMVGKFLIDLLMRQNRLHGFNMRVTGVGRDAGYAARRFTDYQNDSRFTFLSHDVNEPFAHSIAADFIIHAASNTHPVQYAGDPIGTILANIAGTKNVLDLAVRQPGCRVAFLSSVEVYGENRGDVERFGEKYAGYLDCNTLRAGYPEGKRAGEALCQAYIAARGLDIVIPRLSRVYGPTMQWTDSKAAAQFLKNAVRSEDIVLKSAGSQFYSYAYVGDAAHAVLCLLQKGVCGEAYNVASHDSDITLRALAQMLAEIAGTRVIHGAAGKQEEKGYSKATHALLDTAKLCAIGWESRMCLRKGLESTVAILKEQGTPYGGN